MFMRQLNYLVALDKHRHFARAAESCHVSQPALSAGLSELERELSITIIKRTRSFEGITPEGERVLAWARQVLNSLDGLRQEAELIRQIPTGHLTLGTIPSAIEAATILVREHQRLIPGMTFELYSLSTKEILRRLKQQDLHFGVVYSQVTPLSGFDVIPLFKEKYVLLSSWTSELPQIVTWRDAATLPLCLFSRDMQNRQIVDHAFHEAQVQPNVIMETNISSILLSEVRNRHSLQHSSIKRVTTIF